MIRRIAPGLVIEVRRSPALWTVPLLVGMGSFAALDQMATGIGFWPDALAAVNSNAVLMSALAGGTGAWIGGRERRRQLSYLRATGAVPQWWSPMAELLAALFWVSVSYLAVLAVVAARVLTLDPNGTPSPASAAVTWLGLLIFTTLGFGLGRGLPSRFVPLLASVVPYGLYVANSSRSGRPSYLLFPFLDEIVPVYDPPRPWLHDRQVVWLIGVLVVAVAIALARQLTRRSLLVVLVPGIVVAAVGAAALWPYGGRFHPRDVAAFPYVCSSGPAEICVHPAFERALPQLQARFAPLAALLQDTPASFTRLEQRPRGIGGEPSEGASAVHLDDLRPSFALQAQDEFVTDLLDVEACFKRETDEPGYFLTQLVHRWLLNPEEVAADPAPDVVDDYERARRFLTTLQARDTPRWLGRHYQDFVTCRLTVDDFR